MFNRIHNETEGRLWFYHPVTLNLPEMICTEYFYILHLLWISLPRILKLFLWALFAWDAQYISAMLRSLISAGGYLEWWHWPCSKQCINIMCFMLQYSAVNFLVHKKQLLNENSNKDACFLSSYYQEPLLWNMFIDNIWIDLCLFCTLSQKFLSFLQSCQLQKSRKM